MKRCVYTFQKNSGKSVEFGPYEDEHEAKRAFQRQYGTWPSDAIAVREWAVSPNPEPRHRWTGGLNMRLEVLDLQAETD